MRGRSPGAFARRLPGCMFGRCALRLRQCIPFARKRGVLSRRSAAGSGSLVARHRQVHAPCEAETGNGHKRRSAKRADRHGVLGYKGARRKRLAHRNASRARREGEPPNMSHADRERMTGKPEVNSRRADLRHYFRLPTNHPRVDPTTFSPYAALHWMPIRTRNASTSFLQRSGAWYHIWCPASENTMISWFGSSRANSSVMSPRNGYDLAPESRRTGAVMFRIVWGSISGKRVPVLIITSHSCASRSVSSRADLVIWSHAWGSLKT